MTSGREALAQGGPPAAADLRGFPVRRLSAGRAVYRAHGVGASPWWYASGGTGRFDLPAPQGTCYLADSALVAVRERLGVVLGGSAEVPAGLFVGTVVSRLTLPAPAALANLRSVAAARFGVLRELEVMVPYGVPRAWARAFATAGYDGIAYGARFTPRRAGSIACFGAAGGRETWPVDPQPVSATAVPGAPRATPRPLLSHVKVIAPPRTGSRTDG